MNRKYIIAGLVIILVAGAAVVAFLRYTAGYGWVNPAPATSDAPPASAVLSAPVAGVVTKIAVVEGQHVEKGDLLVGLNSGATTAENAAQQVERQKKLFAQQNTS